ncbi:uncharacterized protein EV420DRAFT_1558928, partial [Desarmillaria tabescens]
MSVAQTDTTAVAPTEILSRIFSLSLDTDAPAESLDVRKGAWSYGRVCRRWRSLVLSNPFLWDHFAAQIAQPITEWPLSNVPKTIRYGPSSIDIVKEDRIQYKRQYKKFLKDRTTLSSSSVPILTEYLKRSGGVPLHISLTVAESVERADPDIKDAFFALLLSHVPRWKTLQYTLLTEPVRALISEALIRETPRLIHFQGIPPCSSSEIRFCYYPFFRHFADTLVSFDITPMRFSSPDSNRTVTTMSRLRTLKVFSTDALDQLLAPVLDELAISCTHHSAAWLTSFIERLQIFHRLQSLSLLLATTPACVDVINSLTDLSSLIIEDITVGLPFLRELSVACPKLKTLKISEAKGRQGPHVHVSKDCLVFLIQLLDDRLENRTLESVSIQLGKPLFLDRDEASRGQVEALIA